MNKSYQERWLELNFILILIFFSQGLVSFLETITYSDLTILIKVGCLIVWTWFFVFSLMKNLTRTLNLSPAREERIRQSRGNLLEVGNGTFMSVPSFRRNLKRCFHSGNGSNIFRPHHVREKKHYSIFTNLKTQQLPVILDSSLGKFG